MDTYNNGGAIAVPVPMDLDMPDAEMPAFSQDAEDMGADQADEVPWDQAAFDADIAEAIRRSTYDVAAPLIDITEDSDDDGDAKEGALAEMAQGSEGAAPAAVPGPIAETVAREKAADAAEARMAAQAEEARAAQPSTEAEVEPWMEETTAAEEATEQEEPPQPSTAETPMEGAAGLSRAADTSPLAQRADASRREEDHQVVVQQSLLSELKSMMQAAKLGCRVDTQRMWDLHESLGRYDTRPEALDQLAQEISEVTTLMQSHEQRESDPSLHGSMPEEVQPTMVETEPASGVQPQPSERESLADTGAVIRTAGEDLGKDESAAADGSVGNSLLTMPLLPTVTNASTVIFPEASPATLFDPMTRQDTLSDVYDKVLFTPQSDTSKSERLGREVADSAHGTRRWLSCLFCQKRHQENDVDEGVAPSKKHRIV